MNLTHAKDPHEGSKTYPSKMRFEMLRGMRSLIKWLHEDDSAVRETQTGPLSVVQVRQR